MRVQGQGRAGRLQLPGQQADLAGGMKVQEVVGTVSTDEDLPSCFGTGRRCEIF